MDALKSAWNNTNTEQTNIKTSRPPVLKSIRRQLTIETICYTIFLFVYYDFFDGDKKSFFLNAILVVSVSLLLLHNVAGYMITDNPVSGSNLKQSLITYLEKLKRYAVVAVASRAIAFSGIMLFLISNIRWTSVKYYALAFIICLLGVQIFSLWRIWAGRIKKIQGILYEL
jgi:hypothetical protein